MTEDALKRQQNILPTKRQSRAWEIITKSPDMPVYEALVLAGYTEKSALKNGKKILNGRGFQSLADVYRYELTRKIKPSLLARKLAEGVKSKDLRVALPYIQQVTKDMNISKESPDTVVQVNLTGEIDKLAT